ncbi:TetR family transcriptional regulator [soil metagenome]
MDQIAAVAGTSKAVFYRHFADKADLYRAVGQQMAGDFSEQLAARMASQPEPRGMVAAGIDTYLALLEKRPELYRFVVGNPVLEQAGSTRRVDYTGIIATRVDDIIRLSAPIDDTSGRAAADELARRPWGTAIVGFIKAAGDWWLENPGQLSRAQLTESLTSLLWSGAAVVVGPVTPSDSGAARRQPGRTERGRS